MTRWIWIDGRLSWPLVASVALFTLSLIAIDLVWRVFVLPFELLLMFALALEVSLAGLLFVSTVLIRRRNLNSNSTRLGSHRS